MANNWLPTAVCAPGSGDLAGWDASTHGGGGSGGGGGGFEAGGSALQRSVSRLFQERLQYFGGVVLQRGSILAGGLLRGQARVDFSPIAHVGMGSSGQRNLMLSRMSLHLPPRQHRGRLISG